MRLSLNIVIQILMLVCQAYNQISGMLPQEAREIATLVMGVIQAVAALLAHYRNPDGTPAATAYVKPARTNGGGAPTACVLAPFLFLACLLAPPPARAEEGPEDFAAAGMGWNQYASPQLNGNLLYAHRAGADDSLYSFTFVDAVSKSWQPFETATSITTGLAQKFLAVGRVKVYATTGVGIMAGGTNVGYSWTSGGAASIPLKKGWALLPNIRVIKSSLTDFQWIGGCLIGWGK